MLQKQDNKGMQKFVGAHPQNFYRLACTGRHLIVARQKRSDAIDAIIEGEINA